MCGNKVDNVWNSYLKLTLRVYMPHEDLLSVEAI